MGAAVSSLQRNWVGPCCLGICKIIPPPDWKPQFAFKPDVKFQTRIQRIDKLQNRDDIVSEAEFISKVEDCLFVNSKELPTDSTLTVDNNVVSLFQLYRVVKELGGYKRVCRARSTNIWKKNGSCTLCLQLCLGGCARPLHFVD